LANRGCCLQHGQQRCLAPPLKPLQIDKRENSRFHDFGVTMVMIFYMLEYGWSKLTLGQFGVHDLSVFANPIKKIDSLYVAWY